MNRRARTSLKALLFAAVSVLYSATAGAVPAIWEAQLGATVSASSRVPALDNADDGDTGDDLTFGSMSFPFAGTTYTGASALNISSNGFVSLGGSNGDGCCDGDPVSLVGDPFPRIAPFWTDLDPENAGGDIFINRFNDDADAAIDRIVITFAVGHNDCTAEECRVLAQVQLIEDGTIIFGYNGIDLVNALDDLSSDLLVGVSPANAVGPAPAGSDLSALVLPFDSGTEATVYELFEAAAAPPSAPPFDLDDGNVIFTPNATGGFIISDSLPPGVAPVPTAPPIWETRIGASVPDSFMDPALDDEDDDVATLSFGTMKFPFPDAGTVYTGADILSISSNGYISLGGVNIFDTQVSPASLTSDAFPRIAPFWTDLNPRDEGGDVFINRFDDDADPDIDRIVITFASGVLHCDAGDCHVLVQVQLLEDGTIIFGYNGIDLLSPIHEFENDVLVGISPANGASNPGGTDFGNTAPFDSGAEDTIYELFVATSAPPVDLNGGNLKFTPNGGGGFVVTAPGVSATAIGGGAVGGKSDGGSGHCSLAGEDAAVDPTLWLLVLASLIFIWKRRPVSAMTRRTD